LVAVADGRLDEIERDRALDYIEGRRFAPRRSRGQIAERFSEYARRLQSTDFLNLVLDALRPVSGLGLALDVVAIAEQVAAADGTVHPSEAKTIALLELIATNLPEPKMVQAMQ
jgi:tellurite resistance protein